MNNRKLFGQLVLHTILIISCIVAMYPVFWTLIASLKKDSEIFASSWTMPKELMFANYTGAWDKAGLQLAFINSTFVSAATVILVILVSLLASYMMSFVRNKVTKIIYTAFLVAIMIPPDVMLISMYLQIRSYRLINNFWGIILPSIAMGISQSVFILVNFINGLPRSLVDSAVIDGCSRFHILWKIVVPLTSAAIGSVAVFQFTGIWNSYMLPLVVLRRESLMLLPQRLSRFIGQYEIQYGELFAGIMITFLPVVIFFVMFQKTFFQGTTMGAVKE
jgi:ABC-type glycerol-3-phosphate transport system permease component